MEIFNSRNISGRVVKIFSVITKEVMDSRVSLFLRGKFGDVMIGRQIFFPKHRYLFLFPTSLLYVSKLTASLSVTKLSQISSILHGIPLFLLFLQNIPLCQLIMLLQSSLVLPDHIFILFFGLPLGSSTSVKHFPVCKPRV